MKEELKKSLTDLIDETLLELEELKKSRFSAAEVDLKGPGEGLAGKPSNGKLDAEKAEDKKDDEDEDDKAEKAEGVNRAADPDGGHHKPVAGEGDEHGQGPDTSSPKDGGAKSRNGVNSEADPDGGHHRMDKAEDKKDKDEDEDEPHKDDPKHEEKEKKMAKKLLDMHKGEDKKKSPDEDEKDLEALEMKGMKKLLVDMESLMKSYVDEKITPLETKLGSILELVTKLADQPVAPKGVSYKGVAPLQKSNEAVETLSESEVASKLFELKKSGSKVDTSDIVRAETGHDLEKIIQKYNIQ